MKVSRAQPQLVLQRSKVDPYMTRTLSKNRTMETLRPKSSLRI